MPDEPLLNVTVSTSHDDSDDADIAACPGGFGERRSLRHNLEEMLFAARSLQLILPCAEQDAGEALFGRLSARYLESLEILRSLEAGYGALARSTPRGRKRGAA